MSSLVVLLGRKNTLVVLAAVPSSLQRRTRTLPSPLDALVAYLFDLYPEDEALDW